MRCPELPQHGHRQLDLTVRPVDVAVRADLPDGLQPKPGVAVCDDQSVGCQFNALGVVVRLVDVRVVPDVGRSLLAEADPKPLATVTVRAVVTTSYPKYSGVAGAETAAPSPQVTTSLSGCSSTRTEVTIRGYEVSVMRPD
jgi:hypothetical protein